MIDLDLFADWIARVGLSEVLRALETIVNRQAMADKRYVKVQNQITVASLEANRLAY